jgi:hypothetical protein
MKNGTAITVSILALAPLFAGEVNFTGVKPQNGFVPNATAAIKIAVAVWELIYGKKKIADEKPYRAKLLTNTVWKVEGSLPPDTIGGVVTAFIAKDDARVLSVYHTK